MNTEDTLTLSRRSTLIEKKYKLSGECDNGRYRIVALCDIPQHNVKAGDWGGRVSGGHNLNQKGDCWIGHNAYVYNNALVCDDALIRDDAIIWGGAPNPTRVGGTAVIGDGVRLNGGIWNTTPKVIRGSKYNVLYNAKYIAIGCECHTLGWWEKNGLEVAKSDKFTPEQIEEYREHLDAIKKEYANDKEI